MTEKEYRQISKKKMPASPVLKNAVKAFLIGGTLCLIGECITEAAEIWLKLPEKDARVLCSVCLILLSVLLTGLDLYDRIARHAGAGTLVPITGFANAVAAPAIEYKSEGLILGVGSKMFTIAGPVLVYGLAASAVYGVILYIVSLF